MIKLNAWMKESENEWIVKWGAGISEKDSIGAT